MELWIRSQNKLILQKVNAFLITQSDKDKWTIIDNQNLTIYGTYKSKERALEVLEEIQNMIKPTLINTEYHSEIKQGVDNLSFDVVMTPIEDKITYIQPNVVVYEMPKE